MDIIAIFFNQGLNFPSHFTCLNFSNHLTSFFPTFFVKQIINMALKELFNDVMITKCTRVTVKLVNM